MYIDDTIETVVKHIIKELVGIYNQFFFIIIAIVIITILVAWHKEERQYKQKYFFHIYNSLHHNPPYLGNCVGKINVFILIQQQITIFFFNSTRILPNIPN